MLVLLLFIKAYIFRTIQIAIITTLTPPIFARGARASVILYNSVFRHTTLEQRHPRNERVPGWRVQLFNIKNILKKTANNIIGWQRNGYFGLNKMK